MIIYSLLIFHCFPSEQRTPLSTQLLILETIGDRLLLNLCFPTQDLSKSIIKSSIPKIFRIHLLLSLLTMTILIQFTLALPSVINLRVTTLKNIGCFKRLWAIFPLYLPNFQHFRGKPYNLLPITIFQSILYKRGEKCQNKHFHSCSIPNLLRWMIHS